MDPIEELAGALRQRLIERARQGEASAGDLREHVMTIVEREARPLAESDRAALCDRVLLLATGLGPLEPLLADPTVDEVMVNGAGAVYVERGGRLERTEVGFASEPDLMHAIERILAPVGRRVDEASPLCDARLPDGSRVNVVIPPLSLTGPCLTIRRFRRQGFSLRDLVANGTLSSKTAELLALAVTARASILVSGGTGSGKTTTLNALSGAIPKGERIVTIEDAAELRLRQPYIVRLESRPANLEGRGAVTIRQLVRNALRMRPDRIVIGEVRGGEALDLLQALNTGHDGSLSTVHANSPADALRRLETLALMADVGLPHDAVREQVASAVDVVVHQARRQDGARAVESVVEVVRIAGGVGTRELLVDGRVRRPSDGRLAGRLGRMDRPPRRPRCRERGASARAARRLPRRARDHRARGGGRGGRAEAGEGGDAGGPRARRRGRAPGQRGARARGRRAQAAAAGGSGGRVPDGNAPRRAGGRRRTGGGRAVGRGTRARRAARELSPGRRPWCRCDGHGRRGRARCGTFAAGSGDGGGRRRARRRGPRAAARGGGARRRRAHRRRARAHARAGPVRPARHDRGCVPRSAAGRWRSRAAAARVRRDFGDQDRLEEEVRSATAQARFTGLVVVLLPLGGALLAELAAPGFIAGLRSSFLTAWLVGLALTLQVVAAVLIRRFGRVRC